MRGGDPSASALDFEDFFRSTTPPRDKFLSRLFGLFSGDVVRHWCRCPQAPYEDLGRPHLRLADERYGHTLDFVLKHCRTGLTYVAELKCELEYDNYRYLRLTDPAQLTHHSGAAFQKFLAVAKQPAAVPVTVAGKVSVVDGAVLVWGATTSEGCRAAREAFGFADVLSAEELLMDLRRWRCREWRDRVAQVAGWCSELAFFLGDEDDRLEGPT